MIDENFCAFILTHGRPDKVFTYETLIKSGYTGKIYIVIDDEDKTEYRYKELYGDKVLRFCKIDMARKIDEADNFNDRRAIIYARNACWELSKKVGCRYFIQLDDDYTSFVYRLTPNGKMIKKYMDHVLTTMLNYYKSIPALTVAMSQGGDHMGGGVHIRMRRKAMNSFICDNEKPFYFFGRINEDVNTYTTLSRRGELFFTVLPIQLNQITTQSNAGGMSELYIDCGTYLKSIYSVLYCPSGVKIGYLKDPRHEYGRIHHKINWHNIAPKILREDFTGQKAVKAQ